MKVVYVTDIGIEGGATRSLKELTMTLKREHQVEPIVLTAGKTVLNDFFDRQGIENHPLGYGAFLQSTPNARWKKPGKWAARLFHYRLCAGPALRRALEVVDWSTVDLIHTNVARNDIGMELSRITGVPNICHLREFGEADFSCWSYRRGYGAYLNGSVDRFIAVSRAVKACWVEKGLEASRVEVIYNGVDSQKIVPAYHESWSSDKELRLVMVGNVTKSKGQWQAIEAVCRLPEAMGTRISLDIIGRYSPADEKRLKKLQKKQTVCAKIRFLGSCGDVYSRLGSYHVGLTCSRAEAFGRVTAEYLHAGLGVIASDGGANGELVAHGVSGLIYPFGDIEALSRCIQAYAQDRALLLRCAQTGRRLARERFTARKNADAVFAVYQRVLAERAKRKP